MSGFLYSITNTTVKENSIDLGESSLITDGGIEEWTDSSTPTNWGVEALAAGGSVDREDTQVHDGTYSAKISTSTDGTQPTLLTQSFSGTPGDTVQIHAWGKVGTTSSMKLALINNTTYGASTEAFDFDTHKWVAISGGIATDTITEGDWDDSTINFVPFPSTGIITLVFFSEPDGETGNLYGFIDDVGVLTQERVDENISVKTATLISITKDIDLTDSIEEPTVALYTVPHGYRLLLLSYLMEADNVNSINLAGTYSLGTNSPDFNNILSESDTFPSTQEYKDQIGPTGAAVAEYIPDEDETIYLKKLTEWDADEATGTVYLIGALISK